MKKEIKAVIFEKDGVLTGSEGFNVRSAEEAFKQRGIRKKEIFGRHQEGHKKYFLKKYNSSYQKYRQIQTPFSFKFYGSAKLNKFIISLIKRLHKREIRLALTIIFELERILNLLKRLNLGGVFEVLVTSEDTGNRKSAPDQYLKTLKSPLIFAKECVALDDSPAGVQAVKAAKINCVSFKTHYVRRKDLIKVDVSLSEKSIMSSLKKVGVKIK